MSVGLVDLVSDAAEDPQVYRELDAAARARCSKARTAPLLRLYASGWPSTRPTSASP